ncbi:MAG: coproporphyrinogen dehydrogenase HemZ [Clostridia bacterium]|nr:coproporphyrinogen dehydrogenase HemZ [Clostridia bacterium]
MIVKINGKINHFYVQTLCMIFFPGVKFPADEQPAPNVPELVLDIDDQPDSVYAKALMSFDGQSASGDATILKTHEETAERTVKKAAGTAVLAAGSKLLNYKPTWGILTGVRPSKIVSDMLNKGISKTRIKKVLTSEYGTLPRKAALAIDVALNEQKICKNQSPKNCSLYISIPFCPTKCGYCSFVSYSSTRLLSLIPEYLEKLCLEIKSRMDTAKSLGLNVCTVYIGGGTPTILDPAQLTKLLTVIAQNVDIPSLEEFTLEGGRPDTITAEKLKIASEFGVTRISVNPQSMHDEILCNIGRCHTVEDFLRAYDIARNSDIRCINTDLIAGLPGDNFSTFTKSFDKILNLHPENITVHTLAIKRASDFLRHDPNVYNMRGGDTGKCVDYYQLKAQGEGYVPYYMYRQKNTVGNFENVGYSIPGFEGRYNIYMMEEVHTILAAGAGAVTKLVEYHPTGLENVYIQRLFSPKYPYEYLADTYQDNQNEQIIKFYTERHLLDPEEASDDD